jgi:hypothetical protein
MFGSNDTDDWKMESRSGTDLMVDASVRREKPNKEPLDLAIEGFRV